VLYRNHESAKLKRLGDDAEQWLFHGPDEPQEDPGAFASVCQSLNVGLDEIRDRVRAIDRDLFRLRHNAKADAGIGVRLPEET